MITVFSALRERGVLATLTLAGPAADREAESLIEGAKSRFGGDVAWLGPVSGVDKTRFFAGIDVFLFPTRYVNEAEPLVLYEAMNGGVPVIATRRGCIEEQVGNAGLVLAEGKDFEPLALTALQKFSSDPESLAAASALASSRLSYVQAQAQTGLAKVLDWFSGPEDDAYE